MTKKVVERMCIACKKMLPKEKLVRIVKTKEGEISLDYSGKKSGRGCYVCLEGSCMELCQKKRLINRAFKCSVESEIYDRLLCEIKNKESV